MPATLDVVGAEAFLDAAVVGTGAGAWMARRAAQWPRWAPPPPSEATTDRPILLLHGGLDPTVPLERLDELLSTYAHGIAVTPPGAGHVSLNFSDCAVDAYVQFLADPEGAAPDDCTAETFEEQFDLDETTAVLLFGTTDAWGG